MYHNIILILIHSTVNNLAFKKIFCEKGDYEYSNQYRLDTLLASMAFIDIFLSNIIDVSIPIFDSNTISFSNDTSFLMIMDKYTRYTRLLLLCAGCFFSALLHMQSEQFSFQTKCYMKRVITLINNRDIHVDWIPD